MTLPHDTARCHPASGPCPHREKCARTEPGRAIMQAYSIFPGGEDCEGFIEREHPMTDLTDEAPKRCPACKGRGSHRPPRGCICGCDDRDCEECDGTGWIEPGWEDFEDGI